MAFFFLKQAQHLHKSNIKKNSSGIHQSKYYILGFLFQNSQKGTPYWRIKRTICPLLQTKQDKLENMLPIDIKLGKTMGKHISIKETIGRCINMFNSTWKLVKLNKQNVIKAG